MWSLSARALRTACTTHCKRYALRSVFPYEVTQGMAALSLCPKASTALKAVTLISLRYFSNKSKPHPIKTTSNKPKFITNLIYYT